MSEHEAVATVKDTAKKRVAKEEVVFLSKYRKAVIYVYDEISEDKKKEYMIEFQNETFKTSNEKIISLLRNCKAFGGSRINNYEDRISSDPVFWEGSYPLEYMEKRRKDQEAVTRDPDAYEASLD